MSTRFRIDIVIVVEGDDGEYPVSTFDIGQYDTFETAVCS